MTEKICSRCKKSLLLDSFGTNKKTGQLNKICFLCLKKYKCLHGKRKTECRDCGGVSICEHDKHKSTCRDCGGSQICEHSRRRSQCKECDGGAICKHKKYKASCRDCGGSSICEHQRQKSHCKDCNGSQICKHDRCKSHCKDCNGSQICEHDRLKSRCKECGGSQICKHKKRKSQCKDCDPNGHLASIVRSRVKQALKHDKEMSSMEYLGCNIKTFKAHIESQFKDGMTWENYGKWHIDHKVPLKYRQNGEIPSLEKVAKRLHYTNTQPMWASENIAKGNRYIA